MDEIILTLAQATLANPWQLRIHRNDPYLLELTDALYRKIMAAPTLMRYRLITSLYIFNFFGFISSGKPFTAQNTQQRERQIKEWRKSRIQLFRELMVFFDQMTGFVYFSLKSAT